MLGDADASPSFDMSRFLTCTDGISQAARLSGRTCDRDESMTLLRSAPAQSPHGRTRGDRIQPVSARHLLWRPRQPNASRLLRNTRRIEPRRFRFADGRLDRSGLSTAGNSYRKVASTRTSDHLATFGAGTITPVWEDCLPASLWRCRIRKSRGVSPLDRSPQSLGSASNCWTVFQNDSGHLSFGPSWPPGVRVGFPSWRTRVIPVLPRPALARLSQLAAKTCITR